MKLFFSKSDLKEKYHNFVDRAKTWHQITVSAQVRFLLDTYFQICHRYLNTLSSNLPLKPD